MSLMSQNSFQLLTFLVLLLPVTLLRAEPHPLGSLTAEELETITRGLTDAGKVDREMY
ncbi:MAG: hypothetical protein ACR2QB_08810 [Gammaproteobacteria bacterium]